MILLIRVPLLFALLLVVCAAQPASGQHPASGQSLKQKLQQKTQFKPRAAAPLDQLVQVAKTFEIPVGIEWSESAECKPSARAPAKQTVRELLNAIVRRCPAQRLTVERGLVHIYSNLVSHPHNILNLHIPRFRVEHGSMFDAKFELRLAVDMQLHPEEYRGGWNGGYGYPPDHVFAIDNVSFFGRNITVRNILNGIIKSNRNALWIVRLKAAFLNRRESLSRMYPDDDAIVQIWQVLPLKEMP